MATVSDVLGRVVREFDDALEVGDPRWDGTLLQLLASRPEPMGSFPLPGLKSRVGGLSESPSRQSAGPVRPWVTRSAKVVRVSGDELRQRVPAGAAGYLGLCTLSEVRSSVSLVDPSAAGSFCGGEYEVVCHPSQREVVSRAFPRAMVRGIYEVQGVTFRSLLFVWAGVPGTAFGELVGESGFRTLLSGYEGKLGVCGLRPLPGDLGEIVESVVSCPLPLLLDRMLVSGLEGGELQGELPGSPLPFSPLPYPSGSQLAFTSLGSGLGCCGCVVSALRALDSVSVGPVVAVTLGGLAVACDPCGHTFADRHEFYNHVLVALGLCMGGRYALQVAFEGPAPDAAVLRVFRNPPGCAGRSG